MTDLKKLSILVIPLSFAFGLWWGLRLIHLQQEANATTLKVLTYKGLFPESLKQRLKEDLQIQLDVQEVSTTAQWQKTFLENGPFDLITPMSFQIEMLAGGNQLVKFQKLQNLKRRYIAADFLNLSFDIHDRLSVPILWGAGNLNTETQQQEDKLTGLWLQTLAADFRSQKADKVFSVFRYFLQSSGAIEDMVLNHSQALPFIAAESAPIPSNRKPSFIRTIPLSQLELLHLKPGSTLPLVWSKENSQALPPPE